MIHALAYTEREDGGVQSTMPITAEDGAIFRKIVQSRHSCRAFLPKPVAPALLQQVLEDAQCAPSNCNTQPWLTHIVSGAKLAELSRAILAKNEAGAYSPDFSFDMDGFHGCYAQRKDAQGQAYYEALKVGRQDVDERQNILARNYSFFHAPHVALLFMPSFGDNVRTAGDVGMYGQTFLLSLVAHGLAGIPQTSLGFFAGTIREVLGISQEHKMLFGISFGYADSSAPGNQLRIGRAALDETVVFHG